MILVDTSIWVDHLRAGNAILARLLDDGAVLMHPFVIGELALGSLRHRDAFLSDLADLPRAIAADDNEVLRFIEAEALFNCGIGYVDAHLLASVRLTLDAVLWTRDTRLAAAAERLSVAARLTH
ncbi:MAG TPA: type II toxin-antitoxin system VapC family toxin [Acetobacteraceae bacterium]